MITYWSIAESPTQHTTKIENCLYCSHIHCRGDIVGPVDPWNNEMDFSIRRIVFIVCSRSFGSAIRAQISLFLVLVSRKQCSQFNRFFRQRFESMHLRVTIPTAQYVCIAPYTRIFAHSRTQHTEHSSCSYCSIEFRFYLCATVNTENGFLYPRRCSCCARLILGRSQNMSFECLVFFLFDFLCASLVSFPVNASTIRRRPSSIFPIQFAYAPASHMSWCVWVCVFMNLDKVD